MLVHWIWFAHRPGLSDRVKAGLMQQFSDPEELFFSESSVIDGLEGISSEGKTALKDRQLLPSEKILDDCERKGIRIVTFRDAAYPAALRNIADPPMVLYYKGRLPDFDRNPVIAVVGTRKASAYGLTTAKRMGYQIARCGGMVVSGMAFGIDGMAMQGALTADGFTVGVLGCGCDVVYPLSNRSLFADVEKYGCILSEFQPGTPPMGYHFPKRNRLISGLSNGVLVVEAPEGSGALITARQAAEQGRDVFAVPGNIDQPGFVGSNRLLRDGAIVAASGWDVLSEYEGLYPDKIRRETGAVHQTAYPDEVEKALSEGEKSLPKVAQIPDRPEKKKNLKKENKKKVIDNGASAPYSDVNTSLPELSSDQAAIVAALREGERLVDDVIAETGLTTGKLLAALTMLEVKGIISRLPGKRISLRRKS